MMESLGLGKLGRSSAAPIRRVANLGGGEMLNLNPHPLKATGAAPKFRPPMLKME